MADAGEEEKTGNGNGTQNYGSCLHYLHDMSLRLQAEDNEEVLRLKTAAFDLRESVVS